MTDTEHRYKITVFKYVDGSRKHACRLANFFVSDLNDLVDRVKEYTDLSKLYSLEIWRIY